MEEQQEKLPYVSDAIITYLEKVFPNKISLEEKTQFQYGKAAGIQEVIQHLKQVKNWSEEKDV